MGKPDIKALIATMRKDYKDVAVSTFEEANSVPYWVSTQTPSIDKAIGHVGIPGGMITAITGRESHGKSALAAHILAEVQRMGGIAVIFDSEGAYDKKFVGKIGVNVSELIYFPVVTVEKTFDVIDGLIKRIRATDESIPVVIAWDSVSATPTDPEVNASAEDYHIGIHARRISQGLRKLQGNLLSQKIALVLVNQLKEKIDLAFGSGTTFMGEHPISFHAQLILEVRRMQIIRRDQDKEPLGIQCVATVQKNRLAPPFQKAQFRILFDRGIDKVDSLICAAEEFGLAIALGGGWYSFQNEKFSRKMTTSEAIFVKLLEVVNARIVSGPPFTNDTPPVVVEKA